MTKTVFTNCGKKELEGAFVSAGAEKYRAGQVMQWVYRKGVTDFGKMTDLPAPLRSKLAESIELVHTKVTGVFQSSDGTEKLRMALSDGECVETVIIPDKDERITLCVSTQVGCPIRCPFCASGLDGLIRNLEVGEIVEQVLFAKAHLVDKRISNIVLMGMGEPLLNRKAVFAALRILTDKSAAGFSYNKITLSTSGMVDGVSSMIEEKVTPNLALSIHTPYDEERKTLVPGIKKWSLAEIIDAGKKYSAKTQRDVTAEYVLLAGLNDSEKHAEDLGKLLRGKIKKANLIQYNEVPGLKFVRPVDAACDRFALILKKFGIFPTVRKSRGTEALAACGQLRRVTNAG